MAVGPRNCQGRTASRKCATCVGSGSCDGRALETCIREVITLPRDTIVAEIGALLRNVKSTRLADKDLKNAASFFDRMPAERSDNLAAGLFGLYTAPDTQPHGQDNIRALWPDLWPYISEETRHDLGTKLGRFIASAEQDRAQVHPPHDAAGVGLRTAHGRTLMVRLTFGTSRMDCLKRCGTCPGQPSGIGRGVGHGPPGRLPRCGRRQGAIQCRTFRVSARRWRLGRWDSLPSAGRLPAPSLESPDAGAARVLVPQ
jgi:hypothetical protein